MAVPYYERMIVADIAALKALTPTSIPAIADTIFIGVSDIGDSTPGFYFYDATSVAAEVLPDIVEPDSPTTGAWFLTSSKKNLDVESSDSAPTSSPPTKDLSAGAIDLHLQTSIDPLRLWLGLDITGSLGINGWGFVDLQTIISYYADSVLILNPNETNGSTTFTDLSPTPASATIVSVGGTAAALAHSTAIVQSGYGTTSIRFQGGLSGDVRALTFPASTDWQIEGDYTIEAWVYRLSGESVCLASSGYFGENFYWWFRVKSTGQIGLYDDTTTYLESSTGAIASTTWTHIAAVIIGGTSAKIYVDGVEVASATGLTFPTGATRPLILGDITDGTDYGESSNYYLGPIRIVKGKAVYTSAFTPPTEPFPLV